MGVWIVVLEAIVDREERAEIEEDDLIGLADVLTPNFPVVAGTGRSYETELWVEDNMASGALLAAERLVQAAAREVGLATSEIVRVDIRNAAAVESGVIEWGAAPGAGIKRRARVAAAAKRAGGGTTRAKKALTQKAAAKKAPAKKAAGRRR